MICNRVIFTSLGNDEDVSVCLYAALWNHVLLHFTILSPYPLNLSYCIFSSNIKCQQQEGLIRIEEIFYIWSHKMYALFNIFGTGFSYHKEKWG